MALLMSALLMTATAEQQEQALAPKYSGRETVRLALLRETVQRIGKQAIGEHLLDAGLRVAAGSDAELRFGPLRSMVRLSKNNNIVQEGRCHCNFAPPSTILEAPRERLFDPIPDVALFQG